MLLLLLLLHCEHFGNEANWIKSVVVLHSACAVGQFGSIRIVLQCVCNLPR